MNGFANFQSITESFQYIGGRGKRYETSSPKLYWSLVTVIGVVAFAVYLNNLDGLIFL
jgi:hypothetical protein